MFLLAAVRAWRRFREYRTPLMKVIYTGGIYYYSGIAGKSIGLLCHFGKLTNDFF
jgi:hypothetical protein